jgi:hypothetical protein
VAWIIGKCRMWIRLSRPLTLNAKRTTQILWKKWLFKLSKKGIKIKSPQCVVAQAPGKKSVHFFCLIPKEKEAALTFQRGSVTWWPVWDGGGQDWVKCTQEATSHKTYFFLLRAILLFMLVLFWQATYIIVLVNILSTN